MDKQGGFKVVYVLVCSQEDHYYEQFLLSLCSLRTHNPDLPVEVVTDPASHAYVTGKREPLLDGVLFNVASTPGGDDNLYKSRYLKTSLRPIVKGDFLFLDTDTLVCEPLDGVDMIEADIAAAASMNGQNRILNERKKGFLKRGGFGSFSRGPYYNSGVLFVRDTDASRNLFESWHKSWQKSFGNGVPFDQPALFAADFEKGFIIKELAPVWNCLVTKDGGPHYFKKAKIIHWISNNALFNDSVLLPHVADAGGRPDSFAMEIVRDPRSNLTLYRLEKKSRFIDKAYSDLLAILRGFPRAYVIAEKIRKIISKM
ncbi:MAG: hypothetical protein K6F06_09925 [Bacteroidales bacterium]|nr:hypothetical protein [Bacteroidales bacterium]